MISMLFLAAAPLSPEFDAVAAAPASHRVLLENETVRVLRVVVGPGETEPVHDHRCPSFMYFEQPQPITYTEYALKNGVLVASRSIEAPALTATQTISAEPEGLHSVKNRGTAPFIGVRVEFKRDGCLQPAAAETPQSPAQP